MVKRIILQYPHAARVLALQYPHAGRTLCITKQALSYASGQKGEGKLNRSRNTDELKAGRCWFCPRKRPFLEAKRPPPAPKGRSCACVSATISSPKRERVEITLPLVTAYVKWSHQGLLQQLLHATVAFDVKHISAWVKANNERVYVKDRYDKAQRLAGDPDCRLGVKRSSNQDASLESGQPEPPSTHAQAQSSNAHTRTKPLNQDPSEKAQPSNAHKEYIWGYGSGVAAATDPVYGDVVLAEYTLPFNEADVTYYRPLFQRTVVALNQFPTHVTADAAFDYWYVYETVAHGPGIAAIPLNSHGHDEVPRDPDGTPRCWAGLRMHPTYPFQHTNGFRAQRFRCPLLFPTRTGQTCAHAQFAKGKGCVKDPNWEKGGLMRALLDRQSPLYHAIYTQRTACERINSQAQALGIERPKVRNGQSVKNLNTLIYLVINVHALAKAKSINRGLLQMH